MLDLAQRFAPGGLGDELGAELGLVAGPAQKDHQVAGDGERDVPAVVLLHEREGQVDSGGDSGGGGQPAVAYEDRVRVDLDGRVAAGEVLADRPVRGHPVSVQQSGLGEQQCAGADGDEPFGVRRVLAQPVHERRVGVAGALAAGDEEGVGRFGVGEAAVRDEDEAAAGTDRGAVERGGAQSVPGPGETGGPGEDLHRPGDIEALDAVVEDDEYGSLRHDRHPGGPG